MAFIYIDSNNQHCTLSLFEVVSQRVLILYVYVCGGVCVLRGPSFKNNSLHLRSEILGIAISI